jgi:HAE1 family hydrophobic/amphiphilic exporter-1
MLVGTFCQVLIVPALFVICQWLQERITPLQFEDDLSSSVEAELAQYTMPKDKHISEIKGNYVK